MALLIVQGSTSYALSQQDLQRYPGSTLSSMVTSVAPQDSPVKLQEAELRGSPLGDWSEAASITAALYRRDHQTLLGTLSRVLANSTTQEVYKQVKALVDYLGLPEPVDKLLPPFNMMTLQHLPVLDLYYHALANQAVELMLNTRLDTSSSNGVNTWPADAAYFYVGVKKEAGCPAGVDVYAVGCGALANPSNNPATWTADANGRYPVMADRDPSAIKLNGLQGTVWGDASTARVPLHDINISTGIVECRQDLCFGRHVEAVLKTALSRMPLSSPVQSKWVMATYYYLPLGARCSERRTVNLWVIHW